MSHFFPLSQFSIHYSPVPASFHSFIEYATTPASDHAFARNFLSYYTDLSMFLPFLICFSENQLQEPLKKWEYGLRLVGLFSEQLDPCEVRTSTRA